MHAPIDRAQALVHKTVLKKFIESRNHDRFVLGSHGRIRLVEAAQHSDPLELLPLQVEIFLRILTAFQPHVEWLHLQLFSTKLLVNFYLDRQAVAVPTGNIRSVEPGHILRLDHEILQAFVQCMTQVDGPVRIGRPIVQDVRRCACPRFTNAVVEPHLLPASQSFWLILRQVCLHREGSFGQIDSGFQVQRHALAFSKCLIFFIIPSAGDRFRASGIRPRLIHTDFAPQ